MDDFRRKKEFTELRLLIRKESQDEFFQAWQKLHEAAAHGKSISATVVRGIVWALKIQGAFAGFDEKDHELIQRTLIPMYSDQTITRFKKLKHFHFSGVPKVAGKYQGGCDWEDMIRKTYYHILSECAVSIDENKDECLSEIRFYIETYLNEREISTDQVSDHSRWALSAHVAITMGVVLSSYQERKTIKHYYDCTLTARRHYDEWLGNRNRK